MNLGDSQQPQYASFERRMMASSIDIIVITLLLYPLMGLMGFILYDQDDSLDKFFKERSGSVNADALWNFISQEHLLAKWLIIQFSVFLVMAAYFIYFWIYKGATPGKLLARCRIVDANTNEKLSKKQCIKRFFGYTLSVLPVFVVILFMWYVLSTDKFESWYIVFIPLSCVGFFIQTFTKKKQAIHDFVAKTAVIRLESNRKKKFFII